MTENNLTNYGFVPDFITLRCRICNSPIHKYGYARLLGTDVRYGWCRWWTHGVTVAKLMK